MTTNSLKSDSAFSEAPASWNTRYTTPCLHHNVVLDTTGGMHFNAGEVWDDLNERLLCLDCLEYVTEADIPANQSPITNQTIQLEVHHHDHA